jgi:hypothetical protein
MLVADLSIGVSHSQTESRHPLHRCSQHTMDPNVGTGHDIPRPESAFSHPETPGSLFGSPVAPPEAAKQALWTLPATKDDDIGSDRYIKVAVHRIAACFSHVYLGCTVRVRTSWGNRDQGPRKPRKFR